MSPFRRFVLAVAALAFGFSADAATKMLAEPALGPDRVAFTYAGDVWTARLDGSGAARLTSGSGAETSPAFSPDGSLVAFSASLDGNVDVYVVAASGGEPRRLTWHPGDDVVQGFTPDGKSVLFTSARAAFNNRYLQLYTVPVGGGMETRLPIPHAARASFSPDGKKIAYNPLSPRFLQWKRYRGGAVSRVFVYDIATHAVEKVPQPSGRCNDADPVWLGETLFFRSDRDDDLDVYSYDTKTREVRRRTRHTDFPVLALSAAGGRLAYEQGGALHLFDPKSDERREFPIQISADLLETRPRLAKGAKWVRAASLSPTGARAAFEFRGEIVTVPAEKGDARNLTQTPGAHERSPIWSPDGKRIAYFSDESGEYELVVRPQDGKGEPRRYKLPGAGFYDRPAFSPDSEKIAYTDNSWSLFVLDLKSGVSKKIGQEPLYGPRKTLRPSWSPDSRWIAYTLSTTAYIQVLHLYSLEKDASYPVTDGLADVAEPVFDRSGKYLFLLASTDAGPERNWFSLLNQDVRVTRSAYVAVLRKDAPSPLAKESDEEKGTAEDDSKAEPRGDSKGDAKADPRADPKGDVKAKPKPVEPTRIDLDGLATRILDLPIPAAELSSLEPGAAGQLYFLRALDGKSALQRFDLKERKVETLLPDVAEFDVSFDAKKLLYRVKESWAIAPAPPSPQGGKKADGSEGKKIDASEGVLKVGDVEVRVDPRAEWRQMYDDAWRINRDYFYDPAMHGADWKKLREKYAAFLPHLATRADLNRLIQWLCRELAVGHHRVSGGDSPFEPSAVPGGLLGADYDVANGRYRFAKVYGGLNWNPELRAPLTEPGVDVKAGEYLLAVNGKPLAPPENLFARFENTAGKLVELTVGPNADGTGSRTVTAVPVAREDALRNRDWVEGNVRKVDAATSGRVAYVYVPNTAQAGHTYFKRYFYPQSQKDAIIVDERFNGGGSVADYYIEHLRRPLIAWWAMRYGADMKTPSASIQGPKAMLIDETAGSGGDLLPWMFRKFQVGPLIGQRTWGGLVGILGFPVLMDGGVVTAPNLGFWTPEDGFAVENEGVPPDIEVEQTVADVIAGRDPQLEKAIEVVLAALKKNPPVKPTRPPFPKRAVP